MMTMAQLLGMSFTNFFPTYVTAGFRSILDLRTYKVADIRISLQTHRRTRIFDHSQPHTLRVRGFVRIKLEVRVLTRPCLCLQAPLDSVDNCLLYQCMACR